MRKPFEKGFDVGQKVAVYGRMKRVVGVIDTIREDGLLEVPVKGDGIWVAHPKQCRRLKPKHKAREWWAFKSAGLSWTMSEEKPKGCWIEIVKVREVL